MLHKLTVVAPRDNDALTLRRGFTARALPGRDFGSTSKIISISTGMPIGNSAMPTAERA